MKLHLPKQLFSALLTAITLATAPLALTLGSNAWGGWDKNTYYVDGNDIISTTDGKADETGSVVNILFLKPSSGDGADATATIQAITLNNSGKTLVITGDWKGDPNFTALTINQMTVSADNTSLKIGGNQNSNASQTVTIQKIDGDKTLTNLEVTQWGNLTIGAATVGAVKNSGTLNLRGTLTGAGDEAAISGGIVNVDVDALSILNFEGYHFTDFDGNALADTAIQHGFLKGTQTLTVFKNISVTNASGAAANLTNGQYTYVNTDSTFYVNDSWTYNANESADATGFYVNSQGILTMQTGGGASSPITNYGRILVEAGSTNTNLWQLVSAEGWYKNITNDSEFIVKFKGTLLQEGNGAVNVNMGGRIILDGGGTGTLATQEKPFTSQINLNGAILELRDMQAYFSGENAIHFSGWEIGSNATLHLTTRDVLQWNSAHNLKILTGGTLNIHNSQSFSKTTLFELAGGQVIGTSLTSDNVGLDFFKGGTIKVSASSTIATNVSAHNGGEVTFLVDNGAVLTMSGNLRDQRDANTTIKFIKDGGGAMVYSGDIFTQELSIKSGKFEYFVGDKKNITHPGIISGAGSFTKSGTGSLTLSGNNTYSGGTVIKAGNLGVSHISGLGSGAVELAGGNLIWNAGATTISQINVTADSDFTIYVLQGLSADAQKTPLTLEKVYIAEQVTFTVNNNTTGATVFQPVLNSWIQKLSINSLNGTGSADIYGPRGNGNTGDNGSSLIINSLADFKGELSITSRIEPSKNSYIATVNTGTTGADFEKLEFSGFKLADYDAVFNVQSNTTVDTITADAATLTAGTFKVNLSEGVTLTLGGDTASTSTLGTVAAHSAGTIHLNEKATLNRIASVTGGEITLTGSGTYDLGNSTSANVNGLGDSSKWTGTVKLSGITSADGLDLNNFGNVSSKVKLDGVKGWFNRTQNASTDASVKTHVILGEGGIIFDDYSTSGNYAFNKGISGTGNFVIDAKNSDVTASPTILIGTNNTDTWSGSFLVNDIKDYVITDGKASGYVQLYLNGNGTYFDGTADSTGVEMNDAGGKLKVFVGYATPNSIDANAVENFTAPDQDSSSGLPYVTTVNGTIKNNSTGSLELTALNNAVFNKDIDVTSMTVNSGKSATMNATLKAGAVTNSGELKLADKATITGGSMSKVQMNSAGISSAATDSTKGSISNALIDLQNATKFSISDMTLSGVKISATAGTEVVLSGVDTKGGVELAAGQFTMGDTVTLRVQEPAAKSGGYTASFSSDQLSGITLNNADGASLTVDLGSLPESLTMGQTYDELTITLYGFTMMDYEAGKGLIFAEDSWLGRLLADQGASEYVSGSIDSPEVAALANNNTVKVEFTSAVENGANVGTVIRITGLTIPEPATTTLGLVALAALVTRRRRK